MQLIDDGGAGAFGGGIEKGGGNEKRRTRAHVIADMSVHHLGYLIVRCGFTFEAVEADYGYNGFIFTYDNQGEIENSNCSFN
jgi:hypothetical protein